jgi:hypothetical protein
MRILFLIVLVGFSLSAMANWQDKLNGFINKVKAKVQGQETVSVETRTPPPMPVINSVKKSATDEKAFLNLENEIDKKRKFQLAGPDKEKFDYLYVNEVYKVTRKSIPKDEEVSQWYNVLSQGGTREGVYRALVLDGGYNSLESYPEPATNDLINFVLSFSGKFLKKGFTKESLGKVNLYTIKRIIVDNTLDIMDSMLAKPEDLVVWYSHFSSEVAKDYPAIWGNNKVRKFEDYFAHEKWASEVPVQLIKSEVIIKLHMIMNTLNEVK